MWEQFRLSSEFLFLYRVCISTIFVNIDDMVMVMLDKLYNAELQVIQGYFTPYLDVTEPLYSIICLTPQGAKAHERQ